MLSAFTRNITRITFLLPLTFVWGSLIPLTVMAEPETVSCQAARTQRDHMRRTLLSLQQQQQHNQQQVQQIYQDLLTCQTVGALSQKGREYCTQLQEEGPKQFRAMIEAITLTHQASQQLAQQTHHIQLTCPVTANKTFPKITRRYPLQNFATND